MTLASLKAHFAVLPDPRAENVSHRLIDIVSIAVCGVVCGADDWEDIVLFGKTQETWLRQYLALPHGIPSEDTFQRVFARLDPEAFERCFQGWVQTVQVQTEGEVVAIDGKSLRGSRNKGDGQGALQLVNAWAVSNRLVLGQRSVAEKSNEMTAIPELLQMLALKGCVVTVDALNTQTAIAQAIRDKKAEYVLALKGNHGQLHEDVQQLFADAHLTDFRHWPYEVAETLNKGHGRLERRTCWVISAPEVLSQLRTTDKWPDLRSIVCLRSQRQVEGKHTIEDRYYLSSLAHQATRHLQVIRAHWGVEMAHWSLDVTFREDASRTRKAHGPQNFARLRRFALNLLKQETTLPTSLKTKRHRAAWDLAYRRLVLAPLL